MLKFSFSSDGRVFKVLDEFEEFRGPSAAIPAEVTEHTGITAEMVAGNGRAQQDWGVPRPRHAGHRARGPV
jgi:hypothetical protein